MLITGAQQWSTIRFRDDGSDSPALVAAVKAAMGIGDVTVVAPTAQHTGMGRSLTGNKEARLMPVDDQDEHLRTRVHLEVSMEHIPAEDLIAVQGMGQT